MKNLRETALVLVLVCIFIFISSIALAAVPRLINYQGRLTDKSGAPLDGSYELTFRIYDAENAGAMLWEGAYEGVQVSKGAFAVLLGDKNSTGYNFENLAFDKPYWLEVKIGSDIMSPRQRFASVGYALRADKAESAIQTSAIEVMTSDPSSPVTGQIWYRDDLGKLKIFNGSEVVLIPPEAGDVIQLPSTTHEYSGGGVGAYSIDGNYNTAQSASYSGRDGGGSCYGKSTHTFSKPRNITMLKYRLFAHAHDHGRYDRDRSVSYGIYYWTSGASDWTLVPGTFNSSSGGGDGDSTVDSGTVNLAVDLRNVTKIEARVNAISRASGGEGSYSGNTSIYEIQAVGV